MEDEDLTKEMEANLPDEWNKSPIALGHKIKELLQPYVDGGTNIDSSAGQDDAEIWPVINGVEFKVKITPSRIVKPKTKVN